MHDLIFKVNALFRFILLEIFDLLLDLFVVINSFLLIYRNFQEYRIEN